MNTINFEMPPSTIMNGPKKIKFTTKSIEKALSRMASNTPGLDSIPLLNTLF